MDAEEQSLQYIKVLLVSQAAATTSSKGRSGAALDTLLLGHLPLVAMPSSESACRNTRSPTKEVFLTDTGLGGQD